jgi:hypothetical protein
MRVCFGILPRDILLSVQQQPAWQPLGAGLGSARGFGEVDPGERTAGLKGIAQRCRAGN